MRVLRLLGFVGFFLRQLVIANARVAWEVLTPTHTMRAGIIAVPTRARTDLEVTAFANLISLTPGTLTLEVSDDPTVLYVHSLYVRTPSAFREQMHAFETRLLVALRGPRGVEA